MIRPVGVGRPSRGPIGVEGLTITAGRPRSATIASTSRSAITLLRLYAPTACSGVAGRVSSAGRLPEPLASGRSVATLEV